MFTTPDLVVFIQGGTGWVVSKGLYRCSSCRPDPSPRHWQPRNRASGIDVSRKQWADRMHRRRWLDEYIQMQSRKTMSE